MPQTLPPSRRNLNPTRHLNGEDPAWGLSCWEVASDHTATARLAVPLGLEEGCSPWHRDSGRTPVWPRQGCVGRRPLCTLPSAAQCPGRQQRGPRAGHRGVGSGRGGKEGLRTQLRLGTGRVLAQVCPASRGSRSRRRPAGRQGAPSPPEMPLRTPRVQTRTCARSPNPGGARRRGRKRLLARVLLGIERGRARRRSPALAKARATAVQPRNLGHTRVPLTAAMSPSPAVTRAAGALAQREWGQEGDYRPPPFMASRGGTHLCGHCGGQDASPLPGPGRRFTPPAHPSRVRKPG